VSELVSIWMIFENGYFNFEAVTILLQQRLPLVNVLLLTFSSFPILISNAFTRFMH